MENGETGIRSLAGRLVLATLLFCLAFTFATVIVKTWLTWNNHVQTMQNQLNLINGIYQQTLNKAIWDLDRTSIEEHLRSSFQVPAVGRVTIKLINLNGESQKYYEAESFSLSKSGWQNTSWTPKIFSLLKHHDHTAGTTETIGSLEIEGDSRILIAELKSEIVNIISTQAIYSLLLAGFLMLIVNRYVTTHIRKIALHLDRFSPETLHQQIHLERRRTYQDELDKLVHGINTMQQNLSEYLQQKNKYEEELSTHRDHLSDLVHQRTADLHQANMALASSAETLRQLGDIGKALTASLDSKAICVALYQHLRELMPIDGFAVALLKFDANALELIYCIDDGQEKPSVLLPLEQTDSFMVNAFLAMEEVQLLDEHSIAQLDAASCDTTKAAMRQGVIHQLTAGRNCIGIAMALSHASDAFQQRELEIFRSIAAYAAIALTNAISYDMIKTARQHADKTLQDLRRAQGQLIQSEKMAVLGQLVAGVAHEINTPIGAIKSSSNNILDALELALSSLPSILMQLDASHLELFKRLLDGSKAQPAAFNSREERAISRQLAEQLTQHGVDDARVKATMLVQLKAHDQYQDYLPLLVHPDSPAILNAAYNISSIIMNASNINMAVDRVGKIIFALKTFSRFDIDGEMHEHCLSESIETVLTIYQNKTKQNVEVIRNYQDIPNIKCQPDQLNQVWTNLISNSLQAMDYHGTLRLGIQKQGDYAVVSISDTGCGISDVIKERIFEPFFTTKPRGEGTGLGLDIVKKIIERHKGKIEVFSELGIGTTFKVFLPYQQEAR
ncbi:ATP-binding protein [Chromobacterium sp. ASV23]|uniref:HAMP domain-containing sensor histidine kinase n=1 Tax=Chromobacterium sp. ASV23 TaxID=2795110 RepID=UPI0018EA655A|nr:ATP-binding protein [Chromobacterium sp. ASV23]